MKHKSKIKVIIIIFVLLIIGAIVAFGTMYFNAFNKLAKEADSELTTVEEDILITTETYPTKMLVYGDEIDFDPKVNVEYINEISEESLKFDDEYSYHFIIINDIDNNVDVSAEELCMIGDIVKSDNKYNFMYLGSKELNTIESLGVLSVNKVMYAPDDLSVGLSHEGNRLITVTGTYCVGAEYPLSEELLHEQSRSIKKSNS